MAATLITTTDGADLIFGTTGVNGDVILTDVEGRRDAKTAIATGEQGDEIAVSVYGGKVGEASGTFWNEGIDIGAIGAAITLTGVDSEITSFTVYGSTTKFTHEGFSTGEFKAIGLVGAAA